MPADAWRHHVPYSKAVTENRMSSLNRTTRQNPKREATHILYEHRIPSTCMSFVNEYSSMLCGAVVKSYVPGPGASFASLHTMGIYLPCTPILFCNDKSRGPAGGKVPFDATEPYRSA